MASSTRLGDLFKPKLSTPSILTDEVSPEVTFPKFQELPPETRIKIWKFVATNTPHWLLITSNDLTVPAPSTLLVNLESLEISRGVLSELFNGQTFIGMTHDVYFYPETDTICFEDIRNSRFPTNQLVGGPPDMAFIFPPQVECDSVNILELEENLGM